MRRTAPGPGQESVWDYPRPPRVETSSRPVRVDFGGDAVAKSEDAVRVLETSHPPVYYVPLDDVVPGVLVPSARRTFCEFKGWASYYDLVLGDRRSSDAAWTYLEPTDGYEGLTNTVAFYPSRVDAAFVGTERVQAQPGDFYGGWITSDLAGPFKGAPGTSGW